MFLHETAYTSVGLLATAMALPALTEDAEPLKQPNIVFIMADDMGYGDLGCYGQARIKTPNIDRLASEGLRFTDCYAGCTVCSPSRSVLMTGQHMGHTRIRGNMCKVGGMVGLKRGRKRRRMHLTDEDVTVGHVLRDAGYRTCIVGKWHLGGYNPEATPLHRGFDEFYGWLINNEDTIPYNYFPSKLYRNRELVEIPGNQEKQHGTYYTDLLTEEAIRFLGKQKDRPFFLYLAYGNPHDPLVTPSLAPYEDEDWTKDQKIYASMVTRLDTRIGDLLAALEEQGLADRTVVFFCSDNGPRSNAARHLTAVAEFFDSNGPLRGYKRDKYEGGIRVPMIVRWPGHTPAGKTSDVPWYFADLLPTAADLAGTGPPERIDGISVVPALIGGPNPRPDRFFYWETFEGGFLQAVRRGDWKAVRLRPGAPLELYDLSRDIGEEHDVSSKHPDIIAMIEEYLTTARTESENWPLAR